MEGEGEKGKWRERGNKESGGKQECGGFYMILPELVELRSEGQFLTVCDTCDHHAYTGSWHGAKFST